MSLRSVWLPRALTITPAAALALLSLESGGYYPDATAVSALVGLGVLVLWMLTADRPLAGWGRAALVATLLLFAFAGWTLLSAAWSRAPGSALIECDRALLYLVILVLFAGAGRGVLDVRPMVSALAGAAVVVALVALAAWLLPEVFTVSASFERRRMSYPTAYWNTTGLLAGLGAIWCLHLATGSEERRMTHILGATAIAPLVAVLGYTASRGAVAATGVGVLVYVISHRAWRRVAGIIVCTAAAAAALIVVVKSPALSNDVIVPAALSQGRHAAVALVACAFGAGLVRGCVDLWRPWRPHFGSSRATRRVAALSLVVLIVGTAVGAHIPGRLSTSFHRYISDSPLGVGRLASRSSDGRVDLWRVALDHGFDPSPLLGSGAGTFSLLWQRYRTTTADALVSHSLYIGTLSDLGVIGAILLVGALLAIALALMRRVRERGADQSAWAALLAAMTAWLVFASVDWNWEMPACTIWLFAAGGLALSKRGRDDVSGRSEWSRHVLALRGAVTLAAIGLALLPLAVWRSERGLEAAVVDLQRNDCSAATKQAVGSAAALPQRAEPYLVLSYCAVRLGHDASALAYAGEALSRDPWNWQVFYAQALVQAASGRRPKAALRSAALDNPLGGYVAVAARSLAGKSATARRRAARQLPIPLATRYCGGPTPAALVAPCGDPRLPTVGGGPLVSTRRP